MNQRSIYVTVFGNPGSFAMLSVGPNPLISAQAISMPYVTKSKTELRHQGIVEISINGHKIADISSKDENDEPAFVKDDPESAMWAANAEAPIIISKLTTILRKARNSSRDEDTMIWWNEERYGWDESALELRE